MTLIEEEKGSEPIVQEQRGSFSLKVRSSLKARNKKLKDQTNRVDSIAPLKLPIFPKKKETNNSAPEYLMSLLLV